MKTEIAILNNESEEDSLLWIESFKRNNIDFQIIDLTKTNWFELINKSTATLFIARPPGVTEHFKQLYDERVFILANILKKKIYPSLSEIFIYENKRFLASWLEANGIPHPKTYVFYHLNEADSFLKDCNYPVVSKLNIGASGSGVSIIQNYNQGKKYIREIFSTKGKKRRWGPNFRKGGIIRRGLHYLLHPNDISKKINNYQIKKINTQRGYAIFQEFIPHDFEWRCVCIGDSYFAHKKIVINNKASGTIRKDYATPPISLLDFVKVIMEGHNLYSQAIDIFQVGEDKYLVNEMQCYFGQANPYQMLIEGVPGRFRNINNEWIFEEGDFSKNACYDLRLLNVLSIVNEH